MIKNQILFHFLDHHIQRKKVSIIVSKISKSNSFEMVKWFKFSFFLSYVIVFDYWNVFIQPIEYTYCVKRKKNNGSQTRLSNLPLFVLKYLIPQSKIFTDLTFINELKIISILLFQIAYKLIRLKQETCLIMADFNDDYNEFQEIPMNSSGVSKNKMVNQGELQIWSLRISNWERIPAHNCVLTFLEHHQSTQHGQHSLFT